MSRCPEKSRAGPGEVKFELKVLGGHKRVSISAWESKGAGDNEFRKEWKLQVLWSLSVENV